MVTPNPKPPKETKAKSGSKSKGYSTDELTKYLLTGGKLTDISGTKIKQGQVLQALSDPQLLPIILASLSGQGAGASFDPSNQYATGAPSFEASYNPVKDKYSGLQGVEAQIANDLFASIDAGTDPAAAAAKLLDNNFLKSNYGVDASQISNLTSKLVTDAPDYQTAEDKRKVAMQKQNYEAWRKNLETTGGTPSEVLAKSLGIPALANLPDPNQIYSLTPEELASNRDLLIKADPMFASTYKPSRAEEAAASRYAAGVKGFRPAAGQQLINQFTDPTGKYGLLPTSILGTKQKGATAVNQFLNNLVAGAVSPIAAGIGALEGVGWNPYAKGSRQTDFTETDKTAQAKAYNEFLSRTTGRLNMNTEEQRRERVLRLAAEKIAKRGQEEAAKGNTPFTAGLSQISKILAGTNIPLIKK